MHLSFIGAHSRPNLSHPCTERPTYINQHSPERSRDFLLLTRLHHHRTSGHQVTTVLRLQLHDPDRISRSIRLRRRLQRLRLSERPQRRLGLSHQLR